MHTPINTNATLAVSAKQVHTGVLTEVIQVPPLTKRTLPAFLSMGTVQLRAVPPKVRPRVEPILGKRFVVSGPHPRTREWEVSPQSFGKSFLADPPVVDHGRPESKVDPQFTGSWSGTWKRKDTGAKGSFTLELSESASGQLSARILDKVPAKVTRSGNGVKFRLQHPGCDYAELYFNFSNGRPVNGGYDIVGTGPDCGRGGSYTFP